MSLYAMFSGLGKVDLLSLSESARQREIPTFELTCHANDLLGYDPYLQEVNVYRDGVLLVAGIVRTPTPVALFNGDTLTPVTLRLKCDNFLGLLEAEAGAELHFQSTLVSVAVAQLLSRVVDSSWAIGDTSSLNDVQITLDVRGAETIWSQLQDVVKASKNITFLRYGGRLNDGTHLLDIGYFRQPQDANAIAGFNILEAPRLNEPSREPIKSIRPISGATSDTPVDLDLALALDGSLSSSTQDYQILIGTGVVLNNTINKGVRLTKTYSGIKTENINTPTIVEQQQAALGLYNRCVAEFETSKPYIAFTINCALERKPKIHDMLYVKSPVYDRVYDQYTEEYEDILVYEIEGRFRIVSIAASYNEAQSIIDDITGETIYNEVYTIEVTSGDLEDQSEIAEIIFERLDKRNQFDTLSSAEVPQTPFIIPQSSSVPVGTPFDCEVSMNYFGVEIEFPVPFINNATTASFAVTSVSPATCRVTVIQAGNISQNAILCVSGANGGNWELTDSVTVNGEWNFN